MPTVLLIPIAAAIFSAAALVGIHIATRGSRAAARRLIDATRIGGPTQKVRGSRRGALRKQMILGLRWVRTRVGMSEDASLRTRLANAGHRGNAPVDLYLAARVLTPLLALIAGSLSPYNRMFCMLALPAIGYLLPDMVLQRMVLQRREKMRRSIPDAVDLLVICVDAGLGIDQALLRVSRDLASSHPEIAEEFVHVNREQRAGRPRIEAWREMAERVNLPEILAFANMLTQTERFGTPISRALRTFSDQIRERRRQAAEEAAAKTTVKIIFPLVLFIFPSIFIVLLGPAILSIARGMGGLGN
jgi:tight adherence protein C